MHVQTSFSFVRLVSVLLALTLGGMVGEAGAAGPDPQEVYIESISYGGSGCPQGTVGQSLSADRTRFTLIFDRYVTSVGPGIPLGDARKNCQINVNLRYPGGWSYSLSTVDYQGFLQLGAGHRATQSAIYYRAGSPLQARVSGSAAGPLIRDFVVRDTRTTSAYVWSPCGARVPLNINTAISIETSGNRAGSSQMTTDSIDGTILSVFNLTWRGC
jgi:hypothetical protein